MRGNISVFTADGKLVFEDLVSGNDYELQNADLPQNYSGILFIKITAQDNNYAFKLIKENWN